MKLNHKNFDLLPMVGMEPDLAPEKTAGVSFERAFGQGERNFELVNAVKEGFDTVKRAIGLDKVKNWLNAGPLEKRYIENNLGVVNNKSHARIMGFSENEENDFSDNQPIQTRNISSQNTQKPSAPSPSRKMRI